MEGYHHPQYHQQLQQQQQPLMGGGAVNVDAGDRFPQWSAQETKEFLLIRAELDRTFMETKRNKVLWEVIATKMKEKGYSRSADQCKCKWKNLVTRYKGCETMEPEAMRQQFPFYNELHAIFSARMQRMLWAEAEGSGAAAATTSAVPGAGAGRKRPAASGQLSSDEEDEEDSDGENKNTAGVGAGTSISAAAGRKLRKKAKGAAGGGLKEMLEEFMKQQLAMEVQWRETYEAREEERRRKEEEWRRTMEALEKERLLMEKSWREREEQRRLREEARAEKRDALITALLNNLRQDNV